MKKIEIYEDDIKKARAAWLEAERALEDARSEMLEAYDNRADKFERSFRSQIFQRRDYYASGMRAILKILGLIEMEDAGREDDE